MRRMITGKQIETLQNINISENSVNLGPDVQFLLKYKPDWSNIQLRDKNDNSYPLTELESTYDDPYIKMSEHMLSLRPEFTGKMILGALTGDILAAFNKNQPTILYISHDDGMNGVISPATIQIDDNFYEWEGTDEEAYVLKDDFQTVVNEVVQLQPGPGPFIVHDDF